MQSMDLAQSRVGDADRVGYFPIQTSRQTQTRHDGTDPADALWRASKLILEGHEEDPKALQCSHHEDIYLCIHKHANNGKEISAMWGEYIFFSGLISVPIMVLWNTYGGFGKANIKILNRRLWSIFK